MTGIDSSLKLLRATIATLLCIVLVDNVLGVTVTFPSAVWGHNPVHYYEVDDGVGRTRVIANPLEAGDQFSMQFDSLEALLRWKGEGEPPVIVADRAEAGGTLGIGSLYLPLSPSRREIASDVGYFNLRRAFADWEVASVVDFVMPRGMAWLELASGVGRPPLAISGVSGESIFGQWESDGSVAAQRGTRLGDILDPEEVAERLDLAGRADPTVLVIILAVLAMFVIAVLRVNYQLHR